MTWIQNIINVLDSGLWKFIRIIHSANRDFPYHDFKYYSNEEQDVVKIHYTVGENNVNAHGDQHKYFTSKRMIIMASSEDTVINFNHNDNVDVYTIAFPKTFDGTGVLYVGEFHANISEVFIEVAADSYICIYCEGVLPQEARDAE